MLLLCCRFKHAELKMGVVVNIFKPFVVSKMLLEIKD